MEVFKNPTIYLGGIRIDEPVTTVTDFLVAGIGLVAFFKLAGIQQTTHVRWFRWFFLVTAVSTLVSSLIGHAFNYNFGLEARIYGWVLGVASATAAQFSATYHARAYIKPGTFKGLMIFNCVESVAALVATLWVWKFVVVEIHSAIALLFILLPLEIVIYRKTKLILGRNMIIGVLLCVCAVVCHVAKLAISEWFNHMDLAHVFMAASMYVMYKGVKSEPA